MIGPTNNPINRLEVIDHTSNFGGRAYTKWEDFDFTVELSEQDSGRTLKIFLADAPPKELKKEKI